MDYHGLFADRVEADDENTDFYFSRSVCKTSTIAIHLMHQPLQMYLLIRNWRTLLHNNKKNAANFSTA